MNWFHTLLASVGGGAVVGGVLITFLGKMLSTRITESIKREYAAQLEGVRHQLVLLRDRTVRFDAEQFRSYGELWSALYNLRYAADKLWERATTENFQSFGEKLLAAEVTIGQKRLLLEAGHANALDRLVQIMWELRVGKERLIDLRRRGEAVADFEIQEAIEENRQWVREYSDLISQIEIDFRQQLRGALQ